MKWYWHWYYMTWMRLHCISTRLLGEKRARPFWDWLSRVDIPPPNDKTKENDDAPAAD